MTERRTRPHIPRIALLFDFDSTLAEHSIPVIAGELGLEPDDWKTRFVEPLGDGWDEIPMNALAYVNAGRAQGRPMTRDTLLAAAAATELYPGVREMPERLREVARNILPDIELEFCVLSSGFHTLIEATDIGRLFDRIYASAYHFDDEGLAVCIKRSVTHAGKAHYLEAHGKGLLDDGDIADLHMKAARPVPEEDRRVPFDQMIYCGDGESDLQAFAFLEGVGGHAIAVAGGGGFEPETQSRPERVKAVVPPDYRAGGRTMRVLEHAVQAAAHRAAMTAEGDAIA